MEVVPSTIEVTGAKSVIESISFVKATVSSDEGINKSFEQQAKVRVLDKDLNKLNVSIVPEKVTVKVEVAENSKEVPIVLNQMESPLRCSRCHITSRRKRLRFLGQVKFLMKLKNLTSM